VFAGYGLARTAPVWKDYTVYHECLPNKWNYIGIGVGAFMLLFLFLPQFINGTLENIYYLGAAFWIGVIIYCSINITRAGQ
jgi:hypothetical protein